MAGQSAAHTFHLGGYKKAVIVSIPKPGSVRFVKTNDRIVPL